MSQSQKIFDAQKALFATGRHTQPTNGRVDQLDRMARMIRENEARFQQAMARNSRRPRRNTFRDSGIGWRERGPEEPAERVDEAGRSAGANSSWPKPANKGMIYREPYGVALIIGPFNGPLLLLIRPALAALAAGNTCILTLSEALPETTKVLLDLVRNISIQRRDQWWPAARCKTPSS